MKTLKFLAILCFLQCFTLIGNAQPVKTTDYDVPIDWTITCPGGEQLIGSFRMSITIVRFKDGTWHGTHANVVGGVAVGQTTGTTYHLLGAINIISNSNNFTYRDNAIFVATGKKGASWRATYTYHFTVTPNGEVSVTIDNYVSDCN